jgi:hypothetical protein
MPIGIDVGSEEIIVPESESGNPSEIGCLVGVRGRRDCNRCPGWLKQEAHPDPGTKEPDGETRRHPSAYLAADTDRDRAVMQTGRRYWLNNRRKIADTEVWASAASR